MKEGLKNPQARSASLAWGRVPEMGTGACFYGNPLVDTDDMKKIEIPLNCQIANRGDWRKEHARLSRENRSLAYSYIRTLEEALSLRKNELAIFSWMHGVSYGHVGYQTIEAQLEQKVPLRCLTRLHQSALSKSHRLRPKALAIIFHLCGIGLRIVAQFLFISVNTVRRYIRTFDIGGVEKLLDSSWKRVRKAEDPKNRAALLSLLHCPPAEYGINRTTWTIKLLSKVMAANGCIVGQQCVSKIIKNAGYRFRKAKKVLTSNDPNYRRKLRKIKQILSRLGPRDGFFSIDEFGPFSVRKRGGRKLVRSTEYPTVPQWQTSKGFLIVTAALELSSNQVTHFYSQKKNSEEMLKLLELLMEKHLGYRHIYLSWDAASWHASKRFLKRVRSVNEYGYRIRHNTPIVMLAPLPARAQFLNVIESVFSGLARAIIHNSDYLSLDQAKVAIDRYFSERNEHFLRAPRRAGKKIWGDELVVPEFSEGHNCKDSKWR